MQSNNGRTWFLLGALLLGILLALTVFQVPQPWRAILVAWLMLSTTLGSLAVRLVRYHYEFKAQQRQSKARPARSASQEPLVPRFEGLKVVFSSEAGRRYTIR